MRADSELIKYVNISKRKKIFFLPIGTAGKPRRPRKRILEAIAKGVIPIAWGTHYMSLVGEKR